VDDAEPQSLRPQPVRYPSDLTDAEWAHVAPLIPPAKPGGNKRTVKREASPTAAAIIDS